MKYWMKKSLLSKFEFVYFFSLVRFCLGKKCKIFLQHHKSYEQKEDRLSRQLHPIVSSVISIREISMSAAFSWHAWWLADKDPFFPYILMQKPSNHTVAVFIHDVRAFKSILTQCFFVQHKERARIIKIRLH